ncbi:co-chaperone protein p23-1-like [Silene latifolia]|uniref:co-chaperone protein p23-1-like n=1 Tax=Silene latifolia TaxID=37657 RepID=UPI003D771319
MLFYCLSELTMAFPNMRLVQSCTFLIFSILGASRHPEVKWAEREDKVFLTVMLPDAKNPKLMFSSNSFLDCVEEYLVGSWILLKLAADLLTYKSWTQKDIVHAIVAAILLIVIVFLESKINYGVRSIFCVLEKEEKKWWNKLLKEGKPPHYVKVDWDKWADEDDDTSKQAISFCW